MCIFIKSTRIRCGATSLTGGTGVRHRGASSLMGGPQIYHCFCSVLTRSIPSMNGLGSVPEMTDIVEIPTAVV